MTKQYLTKDEELKLVILAQNDDIDARNTLIEYFLPLIKKHAYKFTNEIEENELINVGVMALIDNINGFDISRDVRFATFLRIILLGAYTDYWNNQVACCNINRTANYKSRLVKREINNSAEINYEKIADKLNFSVKKVAVLHQSILSHCSTEELVKAVKSHPNDIQVGSKFNLDNALKNFSSPDKELINKERVERLRDEINKLPELERNIISYKYGLGDDVLTSKEIKKKIGYSYAKTLKIEKEVKNKLKKALL